MPVGVRGYFSLGPRPWWSRLWHRLTCGGYIETINYCELCPDPAHRGARIDGSTDGS